MRIEHGDHRVTLFFERPPNLRATATLHALFMGGFTCFLLFGAVYVLVAGRASNAAGTALLFVACAAFAAWNGATSLLDPDYTAVFDLKARTATLTETSIVTRSAARFHSTMLSASARESALPAIIAASLPSSRWPMASAGGLAMS